jgi:hypothetical protein
METLMKPFATTLLAAVLAAGSFAVAAQPPGPAPWGWRSGPPGFYGFYYQAKQLDRATLEKKAKAILDGASKGQSWNTPAGARIPILSGKDVVGNLWDDKDLKSLGVGTYWAGRFGVTAELTADGKVVGMLWVK